MNVLNIKFFFVPSDFSISRNLPTCMTCWQLLLFLLSLQTPRNTRSSSVVALARPLTRSSLKITSRSFRHASPYFSNQLPHSLCQPRLDLPIPDSSLLQDHLTSYHQCRHHHFYHTSPHRSSFPKLFFFWNPTLHRHLAPLRYDFMDIRTALGFFSSF